MKIFGWLRRKQPAVLPTRVSSEHVAQCVVREQYHVFEGTTTTVCCLTLPNSFTVVGHSACVVTSEFNAQTGRAIARQHAVDQIWALEGYLLQQKHFDKPEDV